MFTGGGGLDLMFHKSKHFDVVAHSEINKFASAVLEYHYPGVPNLGDITTLDVFPTVHRVGSHRNKSKQYFLGWHQVHL